MPYRLISYGKRDRKYLQLVRDYKEPSGKWVTKNIAHLGEDDSDNPVNRKEAEGFLAFLQKYGNQPSGPVAIGMVEDDLLLGLKLGLALGPIAVPIAPLLAIRDLIHLLNQMGVSSPKNLRKFVEVTQTGIISADQRKKLVNWIKSLPEAEGRIAMLFKWEYS